MAIHPGLRPHISPQGHLSPQQTRAISAWSEQAAASLENLTISEPATTGENTLSPSRGGLRGATVSLSIPLDDPVPSPETTAHPRVKFLGTSSAAPAQTSKTPSVAFRRREPLRRDSLKRREALLKGKDGSRRRQRWENDRLLNNPWAEPPSPKDWSIQPTHTRHDPMPYYLAPLWDVHFAHLDRATNGPATPAVKHRVPKDLRMKLKHARAARGMLQDIEEDIRGFIRRWNERQGLLRREGLADAPADSDESSEDEVVFVGRNGQTHDSPRHQRQMRTMREEMEAHGEHGGEKKVFESLEADRGAGFGRWLVHSLATYYGLHTWSVTVGEPARREAYVGFYAPKAVAGSTATCRAEAMIQPGEELPRPLWAQV
ncbi:hypothetical protein HFD88_005794 [Aspergillus terreus]|nr:hypothetical protein HFD88_005794 [Aspergillus terreus]